MRRASPQCRRQGFSHQPPAPNRGTRQQDTTIENSWHAHQERKIQSDIAMRNAEKEQRRQEAIAKQKADKQAKWEQELEAERLLQKSMRDSQSGW